MTLEERLLALEWHNLRLFIQVVMLTLQDALTPETINLFMEAISAASRHDPKTPALFAVAKSKAVAEVRIEYGHLATFLDSMTGQTPVPPTT